MAASKNISLGRIVVLYGGQSGEREVSLKGGRAVLAALQAKGLDAHGLDLGPGWIAELEVLQADHVFIVLHGAGGEDGTVQGALECMGLSYTGSGVLASALAMDKLRCKQLWQGINLPTAGFALLHKDSDWTALLAELGGEVMVKPASEGSSLGMAKASSGAELEAAWAAADAFDSVVIAERWLSGAEYTVAILNGRPLPVIKLETDRPFYDYEAKYLADDTRYICPCGLSAADEKAMQTLALDAFSSMGCHGWGRVDVMMTADGQARLLEVNTVPGMTDHSLVPMAAAAAGLSFTDLLIEILQTSIQDAAQSPAPKVAGELA
ncbi:MAG: D-alanine--D-alanine ligase [Gammaproteobacteria bacterium]|nr:D-alanine--D-alanine ligase [Gammaproteobacteria bacterium]MBQ0838289.1 D-alanine--D-alanine ligase [Gammaproteobacteria bacterium]